jgi:hypothetical protein
MNRREAVQSLALLLGGTIVGSSSFLSGCKTSTGKDQGFTAEDIAYLNEVGETILPATATPGAKAANVGLFMTVMVNDSYDKDEQKIFRDGMKSLDDAADKAYNKKFMELDQKQRHDLLVKLDTEQKDYMKNKKKEDPSHYFRMMKELTMLGYFTSEIGCKQARRYVETPGRYESCIPYAKGDKAFA